MKERIYLDTSVISYLRQEDAPEKMRITNEFWEILKRGEFDVYISDVVLTEINQNKIKKMTELYVRLDEIQYTRIVTEGDAYIKQLLGDIEAHNLLTPRHYRDRTHIAAAIQNRCRYIVSWNFKHIMKTGTQHKVSAIAEQEGMDGIQICTPEALMEGRIEHVYGHQR